MHYYSGECTNAFDYTIHISATWEFAMEILLYLVLRYKYKSVFNFVVHILAALDFEKEFYMAWVLSQNFENAYRVQTT